jgi:hypothetical protein
VDPNGLEANPHGNDDLRLLRSLPAECVDLVYLDSLFFSSCVGEDWVAAPLEALHRILKPTGSLFLSCDEAVGLYLRVLLVELFGQRDARNRLVWWKADPGAAHRYVFYYRQFGSTTPARNGHLYTVVHREGRDDPSLVAFSFVHGRVRRRSRRRPSSLAHS